MSKITLSLDDQLISAGKFVAGMKGISFSRLVEDLIKKSFDAKEIKTTASDMDKFINGSGKDISNKDLRNP